MATLCPNNAMSTGAPSLLQAMAMVSTDAGLLHSGLPELSLHDWAMTVTHQVVRSHVARAFQVLQQRITMGVSMAAAHLARSAGAWGCLHAPVWQHRRVFVGACLKRMP